ncbi:PTS sugar transporter subunit IIC [Eremococcus coleocola]|uniref:Permease IIC component n=1 Tax=Eremococcus coleocola ACS-139-V-Col8 TaxID=908337 RepID=E4KPW1_9LACT|nr:PTS sugar transporter subunit IIC [Eremococcus coleocola]EFR31194.1 putative PTS system, cellobiose-specific IIC component [Eremococcus coleocola ACS-139-V-Col8]
MLEKLEKILAPLSEKLSNNRVLTAIRDGFLVTTPLLIVASVFLVITNFPIPGYSEFIGQFLGTGWEDFLNPVINSTFSMIALISVMGIGYAYGKQLEVDPIASAAVSLVAFLILTPQSHSDFVNADGAAFNGLALSNLGSAGLFLAMITALLAVQIFAYVKKKGWVIKLPDGVPPAVTNSFAALIPSALVMLVFLIINIIFTFTPYQYAHNFIYKILQAPLMGFGQSFIFEPLYQFLSTLLWFFGINGPAVTNTVFSPIHLALTTENLEAFKAGQALPNIYTQPFGDFFANFGGGGSTLALVLLMTFMGKSQRMKQLGRLSLVPGIFGINEMVIFGLPVVLNPIILVPFILTPLVNIILATFATMSGLIPYTTGASLPWTTPAFFSGWLSTGSVIAGLLQIVLIVIDCLIYYPFFKVLDHQYMKDENQPLEDELDELDELSLDDFSMEDL